MNKLCCLIGMFFTCGVCEGQNLVPNPSFEDTVSCPYSYGQIYMATGWSDCSYTPDYFNSCANAGGPSVPSNYWGYQPALDGNAYAGIVTYAYVIPNAREFINAQLIQPLVPSTKYFVSAYISRADMPIENGATNNFGFRFSMLGCSMTNPPAINNFSHVHETSIVHDSIQWIKISGSFIADSAYQYITIGNFYDDQNTDTADINNNQAYYYLDLVCVSEDSLMCNSFVGINEVKNDDGLILFPNPFTEKISIITKRNEVVEVNFYDVAGRKIFNQSFTNSISISTEQLAKGIYLYEVRNKNGVIKKGKVVKD